jgi:hypothetical protein
LAALLKCAKKYAIFDKNVAKIVVTASYCPYMDIAI